MVYHELRTQSILNKNYNQNVNQKLLIESLKMCSINSCFSTFPYINHGLSSKESIKYFNSGNCIGLSLYIKDYLSSNFQIESFLIPATIPKKYSQPDYLEISHVALAIPKNNNKIYIIDPAFYFINPIKVRLNKNKNQIIYSKNVYEDEDNINNNPKNYSSIDKIMTTNKISESEIILNKYQKIPEKTIYSECCFLNDMEDKWKYYLIEILNPDEAISNFFINILYRPFIVTTILDTNNIVSKEYYIKFISDDSLYIQYKNESPNIINLKDKDLDDLKNDLKDIIIKTSKYFNNNLLGEILKFYNKVDKKNNSIKD